MNSVDNPKTDVGGHPAGLSLMKSIRYPPELPIVEKRAEIIRTIREHQVVVITGETGSGKSTQIPKMCLESGQGRRHLIGCTQPRRIAAITLAGRVVEELGQMGSRWVGYKIRFQDRTARTTRIKFMTDGILLAEAQRDRLFRSYDTIIIDEAHERTLNIDFLLGLVKRILPRRPDLKVIITSATIDPEKFSRAFGDAPIVEVSGRTFPVEVQYRPPEPSDEEEEDVTYVDQAVSAVDLLKSGREPGRRGDVLVFMPTESDIRETVQRLEERRYRNTVVLPLFGRMAAADQQRIFRSTPGEKIVVATNVAETSITIPRIKYVVDSGLARISQYNARSRTQGLPIVPVSRSSADQRKGRCGRVEAGVCIRLFSEEDYLSRPLYTLPEIQRSNLAEVILRMLYLKLGSIQDFPFLDPPAPAAVKDGFAVLQELGAVDQHRRLTPLGRTMARLPLDPRLSRMLLQAQEEGALRELMILAAALSIQDPRERPVEQEAQADQAHARFRDRRSDFVTLLRIWQATWGKDSAFEARMPDAGADGRTDGFTPGGPEPDTPGMSQTQMRRFCREHYLSYRRMREWRDIHEEIRDILDELGELKINDAPAGYDAIHRSVASGYLSHIAMRKEKNIYLAARNRQVMVFPGSGLFNKGGSWIMAAELVHTSRLFARTAANIQPEWLEELGGHLCRYSYFEPHWEKKRGQVVAFERVMLYGLPIVDRRKVAYGRINPREARAIFIRSALVEGELPGKYGFMEHNRELIRKIDELESKARRRDLLVDDETLYQFYDERLSDIADLRSFNKFLKDLGSDERLRMTEADLLQSQPDFEALEQFPDILEIEDIQLPVHYSFSPGEENDGVTATIPVHSLARLTSEPFDWLVPGLLPEKIGLLLRSLPKTLRRKLVPVGERTRQVIECLPFRRGNLYVEMSRCLQEIMDVQIPVNQWNEEVLPPHLRMRFEIVGLDGNVLGAGRGLSELKPLAVGRHEDGMWQAARRQWERTGIMDWDFDVPSRIELGRDALGIERYAYPAIAPEDQTVAVRLFEDPQEARRASREGLMRLYQSAFSHELKQLRRDWTFPAGMTSEIFFMGGRSEAEAMLQGYTLREIFGLDDVHFSDGWPDRRQFFESVERLKGKLPSISRDIREEVIDAVNERERARSGLTRFRKMAKNNAVILNCMQILAEELNALVPRDFLEHYKRCDVQQLPRYLKALQIRAERAYVAPEKDRLKAEQLTPYQRDYEELRSEVLRHHKDEGFRFLEEFRSMLEEFKISIFAPEIKTRFRISAKRLEEKYREWKLWRGKPEVR